MDGMPARVSVASLIALTNLFSTLVYSTRKMAVKIPIGDANKIERTTVKSVVTMAGPIERFSVEYLRDSMLGLKDMAPFTTTNKTIKTRTPRVIAEKSLVVIL